MNRLVLPLVVATVILVVLATGGLLWRHANEVRAVGMLRQVFAAEVQFQAGSYIDPDSDGVGGYGHLGQLTGQHATGKIGAGNLKFLPSVLACPGPDALAIPRGSAQASTVVNGYRFASYCAYGSDLPMLDVYNTSPPAETWGDLINDGERAFLIVAWPSRPGLSGRLSFAIGPDGTILAAELDHVGSADDVANAFFGSPEAALRSGPCRPGVVMPDASIQAFTGSHISTWTETCWGWLSRPWR